MTLYFIFGVDKNVIQVYNDKNIKLFCKNYIDIFLKNDWYISQSKKYYLIFKAVILDPKNCLLFITFSDLYLMIGNNEVKLGKPPCLTQSIQ